MQQLIYGSADSIAGRGVGGWGILHASPDLEHETAKQLSRLVSVTMPQKLPPFPTADELAAREVRFRAEAAGNDTFWMCRSVEAGADHTGRPGNVVSHCAKVVSDRTALRSVDWFFASGWLAPYGPRQVESALPPSTLSDPGGWAGTAEWLRADHSRGKRLRWIVDVALHQLLGCRALLILAPSTEEAARWASVVSWMLDGGRARELNCRIGDEARAAAEHLQQHPIIVGVTEPPREPGGFVLDASVELDLDEADRTGRWKLPTGREFPVSFATQLAPDLVYAQPEVALRVFALRDELAARYRRMDQEDVFEKQAVLLHTAWLCTPGAQQFAREDSIRHLLTELGDDKARDWDEVAELRAEIGLEPAPETIDIYEALQDPGSPSAEPPAPPPSLEATLLAAARLGELGFSGALRDLLTTGAPSGQMQHVSAEPAELTTIRNFLATTIEGER